jgi:hypothetical protein
MTMFARLGIVLTIVGILTIGSPLGTTEPVDAAYGTLTVNPGERKNVSFGVCEAGDLLIWECSVDTLSTTFEFRLQGRDGSSYYLPPLTSIFRLYEEDAGEWKLLFIIDESDTWSATVTYLTVVTKPYVSITDPADESCVNQAKVAVSGYVDYWFDEVRVSLDQIHNETADLRYQHWNLEVTLTGEGVNTIYVEAFMFWGERTMVVYDSVTVTLDTQPPTVDIQKPADQGLIRDNYVMIQWTSSDENDIALMEMNVDGQGWTVLSASQGEARNLSTGEHTIQIRVTDTAGNQAIDSVTFTVDARALSLDGPYYGIPLFGIILGAVLVAVALVFRLRKRRRILKRMEESFRTESNSP